MLRCWNKHFFFKRKSWKKSNAKGCWVWWIFDHWNLTMTIPFATERLIENLMLNHNISDLLGHQTNFIWMFGTCMHCSIKFWVLSLNWMWKMVIYVLVFCCLVYLNLIKTLLVFDPFKFSSFSKIRSILLQIPSLKSTVNVVKVNPKCGCVQLLKKNPTISKTAPKNLSCCASIKICRKN